MAKNAKPTVLIPDRIKPLMRYGEIPGWVLLSLFLVTAFLFLAAKINPDFWSLPIFNFAGQKGTAFVAGMSSYHPLKRQAENTLDVSFLPENGTSQSYEFRVTNEYYETLKENDPIEIVYDPNMPERAYPLRGKDMPNWVYSMSMLVFITVILGTIVRYRNIFYRKLW